MHKRGDKEFLKDMAEAIRRIEVYTNKMDYNRFLDDAKTQDAVVRNLEIIGEAVKNITGALKEGRKEVNWRDMAGMRNKIIHFYFGVDWDIVWKVIRKNLPDLKPKIERIIKETAD